MYVAAAMMLFQSNERNGNGHQGVTIFLFPTRYDGAMIMAVMRLAGFGKPMAVSGHSSAAQGTS